MKTAAPKAVRSACSTPVPAVLRTLAKAGLAVLFASGLGTVPTILQAEPTSPPRPLKAWVADAMTRVSRIESPKPDLSVSLNAARGEWESFQVIVSGPAEKIKGIKLEASPLKGPTPVTIPPATILREHYVHVSKSSPQAPLPPGDYPDALVPQDFPWQDLKTGTVNQPFWVDVFVPYPTPPGTYTGAITVGDSALTIPVTVEVFLFEMPVVPSLRTSFTASWRRMAEAHGFDIKKDPPSAEFADLVTQYEELLARHRLTIDQAFSTFPDRRTGKFNEPKVEAALRKHVLHRHVSAVGLPMAARWPFLDPLGKDRTAAQNYVTQWLKMLTRIRGESRGYATIPELAEPNTFEAYSDLRRWGEFFNEIEHAQGVRLPFLVKEQPAPDDAWWGRLDGAVDIWAPTLAAAWHDLESPDGKRDIARRLKAGDQVWLNVARLPLPEKPASDGVNPKPPTSGGTEKLPVWALDFQPINHRILGWILPLHGITGLTAWETLFASPGVDVWSDAGNSKTSTGVIFNGDGSTIYPVTKKSHHRANAPVASMRLKWLRDMAEDYDYLTIARDLGLAKEAADLTQTIARGFGDWDADPAKLLTTRLKLGELIESKTKATIAVAPRAVPADPKETIAKALPADLTPPAKSENSKDGGKEAKAPAAAKDKSTPPAKPNKEPTIPAPAKTTPPSRLPTKSVVPKSAPSNATVANPKRTSVTEMPAKKSTSDQALIAKPATRKAD